MGPEIAVNIAAAAQVSADLPLNEGLVIFFGAGLRGFFVFGFGNLLLADIRGIADDGIQAGNFDLPMLDFAGTLALDADRQLTKGLCAFRSKKSLRAICG